ncbi:DUF192 domain-containing protein [Phenylobacterium sp.]|uniref:DUF192 domain-containing protein n=1 Tax=Phenylobacterium sp. TaxID=1871053 RepID=UPI0035B25D76
MLKFTVGRRALAALALSLVLAPAAQAQDIPRQDPARCKAQPEITPLQPLQIVTQRGRASFQVEVAATEKQRQYGMMCRKSMAPDRGMLFAFSRPQEMAFWMRNTLIPLDIIYIRPNGVVLSVVANARPLDESLLPSNGVAIAALEIPGGRAAQLGILPGDRVIHRMFTGG